MSDAAIRVEGLSKRYRIGRRRRSGTVRTTLASLFSKFPSRRGVSAEAAGGGERRVPSFGPNSELQVPNPESLTPNLQSPPPDDILWALKDVSFEVKRGEVVGIIGRNGAGKSTLLKILSRITEPTSGRAELFGRVGSLLEVGTGFNPELTGRENIYLNGSILGMKKAEIDRQFDEIVDFSGIERFMDTPVKYYSSGMYVRLAFAVAAHLNPEILLVDEVLAVGDFEFQKKCLGKMGDISREGRTVLFVSHNMGMIQKLCPRSLWIDEGVIQKDGTSQSIVSSYLDQAMEGFLQKPGQGTSGQELVIEKVCLKNSEGALTTRFLPGETIHVEFFYNALEPVIQPYFWISVYSQFGAMFGANMLLDGHRPEVLQGKGSITCTLKNPCLLPQLYTIYFGARTKEGTIPLVPSREVAFFKVVGTAQDYGFHGEMADALLSDSSPLLISYEWQLPDGKRFVWNFKNT